MRIASLAIGLVAVACGGDPAPKDPPASAPLPVALPRVHTAPHSAAITDIAVSDTGDIAFTIDQLGHARLWPALDGTREPVAVRASPADVAVIAASDHGSVAGLLDEAGGLQLVRFDRDGRIAGRAIVPPEPRIDEIFAVNGGVLARRSDQVLAWFDPHGRLLGELAPERGERIRALAVRRGRALVALETDAGSTYRWIGFGTSPAWGTRPRVTAALKPPFALSPDGTRLAGLSTTTGKAIIADLATGETIAELDHTPTPHATSGLVLGFLADDTLAVTNGGQLAWWLPPAVDPWVTPNRRSLSLGAVAITDGKVLDASGTSIALTDPVRTRFLGYTHVGADVVWPTTTGFATAHQPATLWLDRELAVTASDAAKIEAGGTVIDERHVLRLEAGVATLIDIATKQEHRVGTFENGHHATYDPATEVLLVSRKTSVARVRLARSPVRVTPLAELPTPQEHGYVAPLDPARSGGLVALSTTHILDGTLRIDWFREPTGPETARAGYTFVPLGTSPLAHDRSGVYYVMNRTAQKLVAYALDRPPHELPAPGDVRAAAVTSDGATLVVATADAVVALATEDGRERWRAPLANPTVVKLSLDDRTALAVTEGGFASFDVATGKRLAVACGWGFGLHTRELTARASMTPNLCSSEEP